MPLVREGSPRESCRPQSYVCTAPSLVPFLRMIECEKTSLSYGCFGRAAVVLSAFRVSLRSSSVRDETGQRQVLPVMFFSPFLVTNLTPVPFRLPVRRRVGSVCPSRQQRAAKVRTPLQLYVRHLMLEKLRDDPDVVEGVIKQLRKLPWQVGRPCRRVDVKSVLRQPAPHGGVTVLVVGGGSGAAAASAG